MGARFIECAQGSPEWHQTRAGLFTASRVADAISVCQKASGTRKVGDPTAAAEKYAADLAIERISGKPYGEPVKAWVLDRGHEMEVKARRIYEARTKAFVTESGICVDEFRHGYSSDGLVNDDGLVEIKSPIDSVKIMAMWRTGNASEYLHQMATGMWLTGRKWCDLVMYVPDLASVGKDLFIKRIHRDDVFIDAMVGAMGRFEILVDQYEALLRSDIPA